MALNGNLQNTSVIRIVSQLETNFRKLRDSLYLHFSIRTRISSRASPALHHCTSEILKALLPHLAFLANCNADWRLVGVSADSIAPSLPLPSIVRLRTRTKYTRSSARYTGPEIYNVRYGIYCNPKSTMGPPMKTLRRYCADVLWILAALSSGWWRRGKRGAFLNTSAITFCSFRHNVTEFNSSVSCSWNNEGWFALCAIKINKHSTSLNERWCSCC